MQERCRPARENRPHERQTHSSVSRDGLGCNCEAPQHVFATR
jgi:hypothetical protein